MQVTEEKTVVLNTNQAPIISLDDKYYKLVDKMDSLTLAAPSLKDAKSLTVKGPVKFEKGVVIKGEVLIVNGEPSALEHCCFTCASAVQIMYWQQ